MHKTQTTKNNKALKRQLSEDGDAEESLEDRIAKVKKQRLELEASVVEEKEEEEDECDW